MQRHKHELLVEMCSKNIYCKNIKSKIQTEIKSVIMSVIKTRQTRSDSMVYRMPLVMRNFMYFYCLLACSWEEATGLDPVGELRGFSCFAVLTPSFFFFPPL